MRNVLFAATVLSFGCGDQSKLVGEDLDTGGPAGLVCDGMPTVDHEEFDTAQRGDASVTISALVVGDPTPGCEGVQARAVSLFYKKMSGAYTDIPMQKTEGTNEYTATIPPIDIGSSKMFYYFEVFVSPGQETQDPEGSKDGNRNAYEFTVTAI